MIAVAGLSSEGMSITPIARDELVYVSAEPSRLTAPMTARRIAEASLVMPESTYRDNDSARIVLRRMLHEAGYNPGTRIEVEDVETAIEIVGRGLADTITNKGAALQLLPRLAPDAGWVPLRPRVYDTMAIVHRAGATLSPAARLMIELATQRIQALLEPV